MPESLSEESSFFKLFSFFSHIKLSVALHNKASVLLVIREASELKNVPKSGKSPKGGEGSAKKIKKSTIQNVGLM